MQRNTDFLPVNKLTGPVEENVLCVDFSGPTERQAMALVALSHTKIEHSLYEIMLRETRIRKTQIGEFSIRYLMKKSGAVSYNRVLRARAGLLAKLSIEAQTLANDSRATVIYRIFEPEEILSRRATLAAPSSGDKMLRDETKNIISWKALEGVIKETCLSRREAEVALHCANGMTNAEIGEKLLINKETVKFHLHNIYLKFGIRRRAELVAHLYRN